MSVMQQELLNVVDDVVIKFERDFAIPRPTKEVLQDPVKAQLGFYNEHDLAKFLSCFSHDVTVENGDGEVMFTGHRQMFRVYSGVFDELDVRADVVDEMQVGDWVIHHQRVRGLGDEVQEAATAYQVREGLIRKVILLR
jgi:hypothetical protein